MSAHSDSNRRASGADDGACGITSVNQEAVRRARAILSSDSRAACTIQIFAALSDPTRFRILEALSSGELCVCDLSALVAVSQSAVSHQLRLLRDRGLVTFRREANRAVYRLADDHVRTLLAQGLAHADESETLP